MRYIIKNTIYGIEYDNGYWLVSEDRVSKEGKEYITARKTYPAFEQVLNILIDKGVNRVDIYDVKDLIEEEIRSNTYKWYLRDVKNKESKKKRKGENKGG